MRKQTAVEWLVDEFRKHIQEHGRLDAITIYQLKMKAKEMEKRQIIEANEDCSTNELGELLTGEQYYNETYGK
jgi:hypothetical protein